MKKQYHYSPNLEILHGCNLSNKFRFLFVLILSISLSLGVSKAQTITGTVFLDGNNNGTKDATETGFSYVTVKAYDGNNTVVSTATSLGTPSADVGKYTLTGLTSGTKYRIEFTLPSGYNDGAFGNSSSTSIQFVTGNASDVNFGIYVPGLCLPDKNLRMVAGCANNTATSMTTSIASWDYASKQRTIERYTTTPHTADVNSSVTGTPFALTAQKIKGAVRVILTSISSPNIGLTPVSPDGANAVYMADYSGPNNTYLGIKLLTKLAVNSTNQNPVGLVTNVGEYGLGGIAISDDNKTLYVVNMGNGKLVKLDISSADYATIPSGGYTNFTPNEITIPTAISACAGGVFRPSIVKYYAGSVYVAGVCDASASTPERKNSSLRLKVLKMNPANNSFTLVMDADLSSFQAGSLGSNTGQGPNPGHFQTIWKDTFLSTYGVPDGEVQPMVNDIAFDDTGSLLVGIANRAAFKANNPNPIEMGYIVRTWRKSDGTFELENAGVSGPFTSAARINVLTGPYANTNNDMPTNFDNDNRGPGLKYFFEQAIVVGTANNGHPYCYNGGIYIAPGTGEAIVGFTDQVAFITSGARYFDWRTGVTEYGTAVTANKIFSLTGAEGVCEPAPIEIGNRVWLDTDKDGIQDPEELGISGLTVTLCLASAPTTAIATAVTDVNGNYIFSSATGTSTASSIYGLNIAFGTGYVLKFPTTSGVNSISTNIDAGTNDLIDSDATSAGTIALTTGSAGQNNHSYDVGYSTCTTPTAVSITQNPTGTVAGGASINLTANATGTDVATTYAWSGPSGFSSTTKTPSTTAPATAGTYTYSVTISNGGACTATATSSLSVTAAVSCTNTVTVICTTQTVTLTTEAGVVNIQWYKDGVAPANAIAGETGSTYTTGTAGTYYYRAQNNLGCDVNTCCGVTIQTSVCCVPPTTTASITPPTCAGATAQSNGLLRLSGFTTERYQYSSGATFNAATAIPASPTAIPSNSVINSTLANTAQTYTVRIYTAGSSTCFTDRTVSLTPVVCNCPPPKCVPIGISISN